MGSPRMVTPILGTGPTIDHPQVPSLWAGLVPGVRTEDSIPSRTRERLAAPWNGNGTQSGKRVGAFSTWTIALARESSYAQW